MGVNHHHSSPYRLWLTDVACGDAWQHLMVNSRPQLDEEQVRPDVLARGQDEARLDDPVRRSLAKRADPPLATRKRG